MMKIQGIINTAIRTRVAEIGAGGGGSGAGGLQITASIESLTTRSRSIGP